MTKKLLKTLIGKQVKQICLIHLILYGRDQKLNYYIEKLKEINCYETK